MVDSVSNSTTELNFEKKYELTKSYLDSLAKPVGSLGSLEDWAIRLSVLQNTKKPNAKKVTCLIFAADHGVAKDKSQGGANCSAYPQAVTRKVLEGLDHGIAGASVLAKQNDVFLRVIDMGLASATNLDDNHNNALEEVDTCTAAANTAKEVWSGDYVRSSNYRKNGGTKNFCNSAAMTEEEMKECLLAGKEEVTRCLENEIGNNDDNDETNVFTFGEVGIGNTTTSSALIAAFTGESGEALCGGGATTTHTDDEAVVKNKISIVNQAMSFHDVVAMKSNALLALQNVGGFEIAAMVGAMIEAASRNKCIIVDGFIVTVASMIACQMAPSTCRSLFFATKSTEKGQAVALTAIEKIAKDNNIPLCVKPALDMNLRMGEGTGALLAVPLLRSAAAIISNMATLNDVLTL